jgi:hypothetical protein
MLATLELEAEGATEFEVTFRCDDLVHRLRLRKADGGGTILLMGLSLCFLFHLYHSSKNKSLAQVRRKADEAKPLVKEFVAKWKTDPRLEGDESQEEITGSIMDSY